jgi:hypothetical protein
MLKRDPHLAELLTLAGKGCLESLRFGSCASEALVALPQSRNEELALRSRCPLTLDCLTEEANLIQERPKSPVVGLGRVTCRPAPDQQ